MFAALACVLCFVWVWAPRAYAEHAVSDAELFSRIDEYARNFARDAEIPALSMIVVDKERVLFSGNYGECASSDTPFVLGSVSKSFSAVCIMRLAEEGEIDLGAPISDYLPDAGYGKEITVRQLLTHTSGLGGYQTLADYQMIYPQGEHHYANVNYALLGEIIERVSGMPYSEYIAANVFAPLGLLNTSADKEDAEKSGLIGGYTNVFGIPVKRDPDYPTSKDAWITVPAGYISASANDLGKYLQMYLNGGDEILDSQSVQMMLCGDSVYAEDDVPYRYGYGWTMIEEPLAERVYRHAGLTRTSASCVFLLPERGLGVAVCANVNDYFVANELLDSFGWGIVLMLTGEQPNSITRGDYMLPHAVINAILLAVAASAILPWTLLKRYIRRAKGATLRIALLRLILLHAVYPAFLLCIPTLFFDAPLWVARAFVPDVYWTLVLSSVLLFSCGGVKGVILARKRVFVSGSNA